jgi:hypothetical protein
VIHCETWSRAPLTVTDFDLHQGPSMLCHRVGNASTFYIIGVEALLAASDAGQRLLHHRNGNYAWDAWQTVTDQLLKGSVKKKRSQSLSLSGCGGEF